MAREAGVGVLVRQPVVAVVDPDGGAVHDAVDAGRTRRLEHVEGAARVDELRVARVGGHVVHVGDGGEVDHGLAALGGGDERVGVGQVPEVGVDLPGRVVRRGHDIEDARRDPAVDQLVDDVGADEPRTAGDEDSHVVASCLSAPSDGASAASVAGR